MFAYNAKKQAYIKDPKARHVPAAGHSRRSAVRCAIIHPGTPLNPKEKDLAKWIERAEPFN